MVFMDSGDGWGWGAEYGGGWGWSYGWSGPFWGGPIHHSNGTCMSFADGHSEYWKWKDPRTIANMQAWLDWLDKVASGTSSAFSVPAGPTDNQDYIRLHAAIWGKGP